MNLEYSPKEKYNKIVEILTEGVIKLVRERMRFFVGVSERLVGIRDTMIEDRQIISCSVASCAIAVINLPSRKHKRVSQHNRTSNIYKIFESIPWPHKSTGTQRENKDSTFELWEFPKSRNPLSLNIKIADSRINDLYYTEPFGKIYFFSQTITCE
jgi:hypothetical protein